MSRYSPDPDGLAGEENVSGSAGRLTLPGLRAVLATGREAAGRLAGLAATVVFFAALPGLAVPRGLIVVALGRAVAVLGLAVLGLAALGLVVTALGLAALGFAEVRGLAVVAVRVTFRADAVLVSAGLAVVLRVAVLLRAAVVLRAAVFLGAAALFGAAAGFATDIVLAAAVSSLAAMVMALVATLIACRAVDMVLADEVALVAAEVILVAAEVTFAAAEETVRAAAAAVGAVLAAVGLALERALGLLVTRRIVPLPRVRARAVYAEPRRAGLRAVDCRGIDLPP